MTTAIESKQLGGAALDVFPPNSYKKDIVSDTLLKLAQQPNVILSPSIADSTLETSERIGKEMSRELIAYIKEGSTMGSVNFRKKRYECELVKGCLQISCFPFLSQSRYLAIK